MESNDLGRITELSDIEFNMVAAGSYKSAGSLVNINIPVAINVGVALAGQANIAAFSLANQGGSQIVGMSQFS